MKNDIKPRSTDWRGPLIKAIKLPYMWMVHAAIVIATIVVTLIATAIAIAAPNKDTMRAGLLDVRGNMKHVQRRSVELVRDARKATANAPKWLTPELLLGLSINESDVRWWLKVGLDCGIAQNRVTLWCGKSIACQRALCYKLTGSRRYNGQALRSMRKAVEELTKWSKRWCNGKNVYGTRFKRGSWRWWRCLLNTYNQGPWYRRTERCKTWKCRMHSRYWLRTLCFTKALELGRKPRARCRRALSRRWIRRMFTPKEKKK